MADTTIIVNQSASEVDWAALANRALDMGADVAKTTADKIQEIAPTAWEMLLRQAYVDVVSPVLTSLFLGIVFFMLWFVGKKLWAKPSDSYDDEDERWCYVCVIKIVPFGGVLTTAIVACVYLVDFIKVCINPNYYAIAKLFELAGMK